MFSCFGTCPWPGCAYSNRWKRPVQHESKLLDFNPFRYALLMLWCNTLRADSFIPKHFVRSGHVLSVRLGAGARRVNRSSLIQLSQTLITAGDRQPDDKAHHQQHTQTARSDGRYWGERANQITRGLQGGQAPALTRVGVDSAGSRGTANAKTLKGERAWSALEIGREVCGAAFAVRPTIVTVGLDSWKFQRIAPWTRVAER